MANLFTIPQTHPFLTVLAEAILRGDLPNPGGTPPDALALTDITVILPTRRAVREMREIFLGHSAAGVTLLPKLLTVNDLTEAEAFAVSQGLTSGETGRSPLPPALGPMARQLVLTRLVQAWGKRVEEAEGAGSGQEEDMAEGFPVFPAATPAQAADLAGKLGELLDEVAAENADLSRLADLVPAQFADYWQLTLTFLTIITQEWPDYLDRVGAMDAPQRMALGIQALIRALETQDPPRPVIFAGELGGVAAVGDLMRAVARLPRGAVVLPGLDRHLDAASWAAIFPHHPEHPQFAHRQFLDSLGVDRDAVREVPMASSNATTAPPSRLALISEVMRPADTTHMWAALPERLSPAAVREALSGVTALTAATPQEEAEMIALILRRELETPHRRAALVTPDRSLARRVVALLGKWGVVVDDSGGSPLPKTELGAFLDLVIATIAEDFAPAPLMALLKHPLTHLGRQAGELRATARALELLALRQPRMDTGLFSLRRALSHGWRRVEEGKEFHPVLRRVTQDQYDAALALLADLETAFAPLHDLFRDYGDHDLPDLATAHKMVAETLAAPVAADPGQLWTGEAGEVARGFLEALAEHGGVVRLSAREYAGFYRTLVAEQVVRRPAHHARLFIWGPMEARLMAVDTLVLGSLNEGTWPQAVEPDPWLSRPMRAAVGLSAPERKIGRAAFDVSQFLGAPHVYLTRAAKVDGVPAVPSRWLQRLTAIAKGLGHGESLAPSPETPFDHWVQQRHEVSDVTPAPRPMPCPPVAARPRKLAVSRIEDWIANPYAIFARFILGVQALSPLGPEPDAALRGQIIHRALHRFTQAHGETLPEDIAQTLLSSAQSLMESYGAHARVLAFWLPRFERFARWFAETEPVRRAEVRRVFSEIEGEYVLNDPTWAGPFTLTARADRIDLRQDGGLVIYDYKTGQAPDPKKVYDLVAPQLPLEAAIAQAGGFGTLLPPEPKVMSLRYITVSGGEPPGEETSRDKRTAEDLAREAITGLRVLIGQYDQPEVPYPALRREAFEYRFDEYEQLARVKEWSLAEGEGGGE